MFCHKCGNQMPDGNKFCMSCGAPQLAQPGNTPPQQAYAPPEQAYTPPQQACIPPEQPYTLPQESYASPEQPYVLPQQAYTTPEQAYTPPQHAYAPPEQTYTPQQTYYPPGYTDRQGVQPGKPSAGKKGGLWWKIAIPVTAVVIAAAAVVYFFVLRGPANTITRALSNVRAEITQRMDGSPLKAINMMSKATKDGTISVSFNYKDSWYDRETSGTVSLSSRYEDRDFALTGDFLINDFKFDFEAFLNRERLAFGSSRIDGNYYGVTFSTFSEDIRVLGDTAGLDEKTMDQMTEFVKIIEKALQPASSNKKDSSAYVTLLTDFYKKCEQTSERVEINPGGNNVKVTRIDTIITKEAILRLLDDLYDLIDRDENINEIFDTLDSYESMGMPVNISRRDVMRQISSLIRDFDKYFSDSGTITLSLFIGGGDRLARMEINTNFKYDGERVKMSASFDFGASAKDRWVFRVDFNGTTEKIEWSYKEKSNSVENTIVITNGDDLITLGSEWSPTRGDFTLFYEYEYGWSGQTQTGEITGVFKEDTKGFILTFDDLSSYDSDSLKIEIKAEYGAKIKQIEYINIDKWKESFLDKLENVYDDARYNI